MITARSSLHYKVSLILFGMLGFICVNLAPSAQAQTDIYLMVDVKSNPPYILTEGEEVPTIRSGASFAILSAISERLGINFHFQRLPWVRGLKRVETGDADGIFHASYREERTAYSSYPMLNGAVDSNRRIMSQAYYLYFHKDRKLHWDGEQFTNVKLPIGATIGYSVVKDLKKLKLEVEEAHSHEMNLTKVLKGRLAAYAQLEQIADSYLARNPNKFAEIRKHPIPIKRKDYFLIFSNAFLNRHDGLAVKIWDEFAKLRESGEISRIVLSYSN